MDVLMKKSRINLEFRKCGKKEIETCTNNDGTCAINSMVPGSQTKWKPVKICWMINSQII